MRTLNKTIEEVRFLKSLHKPVYYKTATDITISEPSRKASGYLAAFNNMDDDYDVLLKGCFAKSIQEHGPNSTSPRKIAYLWMHDMKEPVGKMLLLEEHDQGLYFEAEISKIALGDRLITQYLDGSINQHSIGFRYIWDKCDWEPWKGEEAFVCHELKLMEGSPVTIGMNENTPFTGMKAATLDQEFMLLDRETEKLINRLSDTESYELRRLISKHISLTESRFESKKSLTKPVDLKQSRKERNERLIEYVKQVSS